MRIGIDGRKIGDYGIGTYIRGLLGGLVEIDAPEEYVVFAPRGAAVPSRFEHVVFDAPHYSARELFALGRTIRAAKLDLFHAPHYVVPVTDTPVIVTIHDLIHLHMRHRNPIKPIYARMMMRHAVQKSVRVLTVSEYVKQDIVATFGCPGEQVVVTPNGVSFSTAENRQPKAGSSDFFLFVGNDKPHKNVEALVEAFAAVRKKRGDLRLLLAGAPFARFANREGVECVGFVDDVASLYRNALAVIVPSKEEGFGLPALEAMACGAPVITSLAQALVEVTDDAALHTNDFGQAMLRIANDEALRRELAQRGVARASQFTWRACAMKTRDVYVGQQATGNRQQDF